MNDLSTIAYSDFVGLAYVAFQAAKDAVDRNMTESGIFKMIPVPLNSGESRKFAEIDLELYAKRKFEGDQAKRARTVQGYSKTATIRRFGLEQGITWEMRNLNKNAETIAALTSLGEHGMNRRELDLTHRITFAASTTYTDQDGVVVSVTTGDGLALASTVHTLTGSATTYRSRIANNPSLSKGGLEAAEKLFAEQRYNNLGQKVKVTPDILFTTDDPNTVNTARELLLSTASVDSGANSGVKNVNQGKYKHVILPLLATDKDGALDSTKTKYWGLIASSSMPANRQDFICAVWEEPTMVAPKAGGNREDSQTDDWTFGTRTAYDIITLTGRPFVLSSGDGTA
jgi:hypothetical protein